MTFIEYCKAVFASDLSSKARLTAIAIADHYKWSESKAAYPSDKTISRETGLSLRSITRAKSELVNKGWMHSKQRLDSSCLYTPLIPDPSVIVADPFVEPFVEDVEVVEPETATPSVTLADPLRHPDVPLRHSGVPPQSQWLSNREYNKEVNREVNREEDTAPQAAAVVEEVEDEWDLQDMDRVNKVRADALTFSIKEEGSMKVVEDLSLLTTGLTTPLTSLSTTSLSSTSLTDTSLTTAEAPAAPSNSTKDAPPPPEVEHMIRCLVRNMLKHNPGMSEEDAIARVSPVVKARA